MKKPLTSIPLGDLYGLRTVILIETEPQSNTYRQITLNRDQFRDLCGIMRKHFTMPNGASSLPVTKQEVVLPEGYRDFYESNEN